MQRYLLTSFFKTLKVDDDVSTDSQFRGALSIGNGTAEELVSLDNVDHALAAKMHLVNNVRMKYQVLDENLCLTVITRPLTSSGSQDIM